MLLAGLEKLLGPSLLWWRIVRVAADAVVALLVFILVRRAAPLPVALVAWLIAAAGMAQPGGPNPFPVALAFGLAAFAVATAAPPRSGASAWRRPVAAGALVALRASGGLTSAYSPRPRLRRSPGPGVAQDRRAGGLHVGRTRRRRAACTPPLQSLPTGTCMRLVAAPCAQVPLDLLPNPFEADFGLAPGALVRISGPIGSTSPELAWRVGVGACVADCAVGERTSWRWGARGLRLGRPYMRQPPSEFHTSRCRVVAVCSRGPRYGSSAIGAGRPGAFCRPPGRRTHLLVLHGSANRCMPSSCRTREGGTWGDGWLQAPPDEARVTAPRRDLRPGQRAAVEPIFVSPAAPTCSFETDLIILRTATPCATTGDPSAPGGEAPHHPGPRRGAENWFLTDPVEPGEHKRRGRPRARGPDAYLARS